MENAVDALKMVFAVLVFIIALSITFYLFTKTKETADILLRFADRENFSDYDYQTLDRGREVHIDTVISTLKNYKTQSSYVRIERGGVSKIYDYSSTAARDVEDTVKDLLENHSKEIYLESIEEITTGGTYILGEDGTRLIADPTGANTRRYIVYRYDRTEP